MRILKPFVGLDNYKLLQSVQQIKEQLSVDKETFEEELWPNSELTNPVPWIVIKTSTGVSFFFANDKLFKIYVEDNNDFGLDNGISIGLPMEKAQEIDSSLTFDDWNEDWSSEQGYWLEDELDHNTVMSITIFIKEALDEDTFDKYEW